MLSAVNSDVAIFFNLTVVLITLLFVFGIPALIIGGYMWWSRRL
jgi:hypothetical protein